MTTRRELIEGLDADYVTAWKRPGWGARLFPSFTFYRRVAATVLRASEHARYGFFSDATWRDAAAEIVEAIEAGGVPVIAENLSVFSRITQPCVVIGNHMSTSETFVLPKLLLDHRPVTFVVKRALVEYPVFKHIMRATHPVVVGREDPRADLRAVLEGGTEKLNAGVTVVIFPQRTRTVDFDPSQFNSIGVKLAKRAGVPVVPLAVKTDAWSNGKRLKDFGPFVPDRPMHFAFGEPMEVTGNGRETNEAVVRFIRDRLANWAEWDARWRSAG